jgi:hypothetical protein
VAQRAGLTADHVALSTRQSNDAALLAGRLIVYFDTLVVGRVGHSGSDSSPTAVAA